MLVAELIKAAYSNITASLETPTPDQYAQALRSLNSMIASWGRDRLTLYGLVDESFTLVPGQLEYTVGVGGDFNTAWPYQIDNAFIRDANGLDYGVKIITQNEYDDIPLKTLGQRPYELAYNPKGYPTGSVKLYPVPVVAETLHWTAQKVIIAYATIENEVGIAPEFEEALEYNLSIRLAPKMGGTVTPELMQLAKQSKAVIPTVMEPAVFDGAFGSSKSVTGIRGIYSGYM